MVLRRRRRETIIFERDQFKDCEIQNGRSLPARRLVKLSDAAKVNKLNLALFLSTVISILLLLLSTTAANGSEIIVDMVPDGYTHSMIRESVIGAQRDGLLLLSSRRNVQISQTNQILEQSMKLPKDFNIFYHQATLVPSISDYQPKLSDYDLSGEVYSDEDYTDDNMVDTKEWYSSYYSYDDDYNRNDSTRSKSCRRTEFHRNHHPTCNTMHESPILSDEYEGYYFSSGTFRDAFSIYHDEVVLKIGSYEWQTYNYELYEMIRIDANVMNQLSAHKQIVDIYGHCGVSIAVKSMNGPSLQEVFMNFKRNEMIEDGEEDELPGLLNPTEKLNLATKMAEALSLLHSHPGGVIVHGDLQYVQFLLDEDGETIVLSDFNRAEPLLFDESAGEYCKYVVARGGGNVRAPEEYSENILDEKIDVYSFGPILYSILTGYEPFVDDHHIEEEDTGPFVIGGLLPIVPTDVRGNSFAEAALVAIMYKCLEYYGELFYLYVYSVYSISFFSTLMFDFGSQVKGEWIYLLLFRY